MIYLIDLILNLTLLVALTVVSGFVRKRWGGNACLGPLSQGVLFGSAAVFGMLHPLNFSPGVIFDGRSVMISLCALFFGPWAAGMACAMTILVRVGLGGAGVLMGVLVILSSAGIGLLTRSRFNPESEIPSVQRLYLFGLVVHLAMLALMFTLPEGAGLLVVKNIGLPVLLLYPLATILTGKILSDQLETERTMAMLRASRTRLIEAQHIAKTGDFTWDVKTGEVTWSDGLFDMLQYEKSEKIDSAKVNAEIHYPEDLERVTKWLGDCIASGKKDLTPNEYRLIRKDGSVIYVHTVGVIKYEQGKYPKVFATIQDITERMNTETALRENRVIMESFLENSPVYIFFKDHEIRALMLSRNYEQLLGMPLKNILGKTMDELFPSDLAKNMIEIDKQILSEGKNVTVIEEFGGRIYETTKFPIRIDGKPNMLAGFTLDITESKLAEEKKEKLQVQLTQAQKMEAIGVLAGGIAHDFNNILAVIIGYTDLAIEDAPSGSQFAKDLGNVMTASQRAKELVTQILAFSRQSEVDRMFIQIQPLIKESLKMLRSSIPTTISITEDIHPQCGVVLADPTQIHQILMNLCTNAYHAMEETGGELAVSLKTVSIIPDDEKKHLHLNPGDYVELTVTDTGSGIGPDVIEKIFDPFFTTKEIGKGTGMGLSIIHGIMKDYGGAVAVDSQLGKGSTFHVYFPVVEKEAIPEAKESEYIPLGTERILFIDDEELLAEMGKDILERLGYHVTVRRSSFEALETFQNTPDAFDVVITDQTMPGITGSDISRRMLQIRPDIPIILCTGYSNQIDEASAKTLGIKAFALKPLTKGVLAKLIRKVLKVEAH